MSDDISYNYPAMEAAAQRMSNIHKQINQVCDDLETQGNQVVAGHSGVFIDEYHAKARELNAKQTEFNNDFGARIKQYETEYEAMRGMDVNLGATF
jgi:uncharacterized protein YukE